MCVCACVRACVCACVRACVRACVCVCVHSRARVGVLGYRLIFFCCFLFLATLTKSVIYGY